MAMPGGRLVISRSKIVWGFIALLLGITPSLAFASCDVSGYTIVFINGIHTLEPDARNESKALGFQLPISFNGQSLTVKLGYNQTHLDGHGDEIKSAMQSYKTAASPLFEDFDLDTILNDIHSQVKTRKILIVGHSQGTLYANELYKYLTTKGGVPKEDVAVYNIATPASYVAGGGQYLTSANDKVINYVRTIDAEGDAPIALEANILIPLPKDEINDDWGGHHFQSDYLNGAGGRIVSEIENELSTLEASDADTGVGCFIAPGEPLSYKAKEAVFAVAEPISHAVDQKVSGDIAGITSTASDLANAAKSVIGAVQFAFTPRDDQETLGMFGVVKSLYGSSLSSSDVADLLGNGSGQPAAVASANSDPGATNIAPGTDPTPGTIAQRPTSDVESLPPDQESQPQAPAPTDTTISDTADSAGESPTLSTLPSSPTPEQESSAVPQAPMYSIAPGFGGGAAPASETSQEESPADESDESEPDPAAEIALAILSPEEGAYIATTTVEISGTADADSIVFVASDTFIATTTAAADGTWKLPLQLAEGGTTIAVSALTNIGSSATSTRTFTVDVTPPVAPTASIDACAESLDLDFCLVPVDSTELSWNGSADYWSVYKNDVLVGTTTATSTNISLAENATSTFAVVAYDAAGNSSTSSAIKAVAVKNPVVINEIGWGGISSDADDQWIELKNTTPYEIDLSHVVIHRAVGNIVLSGTIPASWYRIIARTSDAHISQPIVEPFDPLAAEGEELQLVWDDSVLDATPAVATCGGWCAGSKLTDIGRVQGIDPVQSPVSMERIDESESGESSSNWRATDGYGSYGTGGQIWGTPGDKNSFGLPTAGVFCDDPSNLAVADTLFAPGDWSCTFLSRFIGGTGSYGSNRYIALYQGDVGSSTRKYMSLVGRYIASTRDVGINVHDAVAGEHFFFAIWEQRSGSYAFGDTSDTARFDRYFQTGASASTTDPHPPHDNYVVIPFTYAPAGE